MGFSRDDVENLSSVLEEPGWVLDRRLEAWEWFDKLELPGEKEEPWRYTNLAMLRFKLDRFSPAPPSAPYPMALPADVASKDVIVTDLHTAIREHPELVQKHLFSEVSRSSHIFSALHGAFFSGGTFVYVPRGVTVPIPIEVITNITEPGAAVCPHNLLVVEEGAELCFLQRFTSGDLAEASLSATAMEVIAGQAARVFTSTLQEFGSKVWHFEAQAASVARDVSFQSSVATLGGRFSRTEASTVMRGDGASVEMLGMYLAEQGQHFDFRTLQDHAAAHCTSDLLFKGALRGNARTVYAGLIHVRPEGAQTDAYQTNRNLILSDDAKADSKPELEIENNDVRCSHAASVGQMNEDEIFYLVSRGIPRPEAERLIVKGFFEEVLGRIRRAEISEPLHQALERKLGYE
ncbi:MAG TPA: Fe-S cluster assembly protein SufD [Actinomycetota bacterium]|nr:Fe-S cluster assembly protein SufD [Actinomycetota bacterium]